MDENEPIVCYVQSRLAQSAGLLAELSLLVLRVVGVPAEASVLPNGTPKQRQPCTEAEICCQRLFLSTVTVPGPDLKPTGPRNTESAVWM